MKGDEDGRDGDGTYANVNIAPLHATPIVPIAVAAQRSRFIRRGEDGRSRERPAERADLSLRYSVRSSEIASR